VGYVDRIKGVRQRRLRVDGRGGDSAIAFLDVKDALAPTDGLRLQFAAQCTRQQSVGDDLLMGQALSAEQLGQYLGRLLG
jgi:hypothetical protein